MPTYIQFSINAVWGQWPYSSSGGYNAADIFGVDLRKVTHEYNSNDFFSGFGYNSYNDTWKQQIYTHCKKQQNTFYWYAWNRTEDNTVDCSYNQFNTNGSLYYWIAL